MRWCFLLFFVVSCGSPPVKPPSLWQGPTRPESESAGEVTREGSRQSSKSENGEDEGGATETAQETAAEESPLIKGMVVINEIFYDADGPDTDGLLFVELFGTAGIPLGGFQVLFVNGSDGTTTDSITLPDGAVIAEDGFYLIADSRTEEPNRTQVEGADLIDNFDPQNGPDAVLLLDPEGNPVDTVGYGEGMVGMTEGGLSTFEGSPAVDVVGGHSLERGELGIDTDDNVVDFVERETPTPGL